MEHWEDQVPDWCDLAEPSWASILNLLAQRVESGRTVVLVRADAPFQNLELFRRLAQLHETYRAHFTFADAYPTGLGVDLVASAVLKPMADLATRVAVPMSTAGLFEVLRTDVNAFDIETEIASDDLRMLRLSFFADSPEHLVLIKRLAPLMQEPWYEISPEAISSLVREQGKLLRTIPNYFTLALTDTCPQSCSYCPWGESGKSSGTRSMDQGKLKNLVSSIVDFNPAATISVSLFGEPSLYPGFEAFARQVLEETELDFFVETSGIGWNQALLERLAGHPQASRMTWIVSLDNHDPERYEKLRGPGYAEAWACARKLKELFGKNAYIQAVRSTENEENLQDFYKKTKAEGLNPIIQKYDHFSHRIADRRISDIAPFTRFPCWHVKRDMTILVDGTVVPCREDLEGTRNWGNVFEQDIQEVWARGQALHEEHLKGIHTGPCEFCDEYYTYNA